MDDELLDQLAYELGKVLKCEEQCPGVYYLGVQPTEDMIGQEYYVVLEDAPITQEVRAMGRPLQDIPALLYPIEAEEGPRFAVEYEVLRYLTKSGLPLPEGTSLRETALYGMELCPDYFGTYPVPPQTPWGYTLRHRPLDAGIYWLETDQCVEVLVVCYPIWATEFSDHILCIAHRLDHEGVMGLYFSKESACVAVWELMRTRLELTSLGLIRKAELMNAIWEYYPEYAMGYNAQEQAGLNDGLGLILYALGFEDRELEGSPEHMISMTEGIGTDYIGFWK